MTKPPTASSVYWVIALGIVGLIATLTFLFLDIRYNTPRYYIEVLVEDKKPVDTIYATIGTNLKTDSTVLKHIRPRNKALDYSKIFLHLNSTFLVWMSLFSVMMAFTLAVIPVLVHSIKELKEPFNIKGVQYRLIVAVAVVLGSMVFIVLWHPNLIAAFETMDSYDILLYHPEVLNFLILLCQMIAMIAVYGNFIINEAIDKLDETKLDNTLVQFNMLRQKLRFFLGIVAAFIVVAILTTDALRRSIVSEITSNIELFPANFVYIYGMIFTFFLAVLYLPIYFRLRHKGEAIANEIDTRLATENKSVTKEEREKYLTTFFIKETPLQSFQIALSLLSPVISSLVPNLISL